MTAERLHVHTAILPIRWGDMDLLGHVNNTEYFRYDILANGAKYADGAAKIVWIDFATGRSTPLPEHIAAPLRGLAREGS